MKSGRTSATIFLTLSASLISIFLSSTILSKQVASKFDGFDGISTDRPTTFAPRRDNQIESQLPLNPVWPVTMTVLSA
tara:strand:- start:282 stop:515 length:234 start_codon:yes stop_codon:yes gene_type:complete